MRTPARRAAAIVTLLVPAIAFAATSNPRAGRAYVIDGANGALLWTLQPPIDTDDQRFGNAVAGVGDVNGDSVPDVAVGAPRFLDPNRDRVGRVFVYSGADGTLLQTLAPPAPATAMRFGYAVAGAGDLDGDGGGDVLVGAPSKRTPGRGRTGEAYLYSGASGALLGAMSDPNVNGDPNFRLSAGSRFGLSLAAGTDLDDDGLGDLLVGAPLSAANGRENVGRVFLFGGGTRSLLKIFDDPRPQRQARFGISVAFTDSANADAVPDVVIGADGQNLLSGDFAGRVWLMTTNPDPNSTDEIANFTPPFPQPFANFGFQVAGVGDVNADGRGDLAASAPDQPTVDIAGGEAFVLGFDPNSAGTVVTRIATLDDPSPHRIAFYGGGMASMGDLTGDGLAEVAVGSELHRDPNGVRAGRVYLQQAADGSVVRTIEAPDADACSRFGWSVAPAGDVNRDGVTDLIVGAPFHRVTSRYKVESCF